ncbi:unnamed protein product, partial [Staurois parvus]
LLRCGGSFTHVQPLPASEQGENFQACFILGRNSCSKWRIYRVKAHRLQRKIHGIFLLSFGLHINVLMEMIALGDNIEEFRLINYKVVACSVDFNITNLALIDTLQKQGGLGPMTIPLLSNLTHQISRDYGAYLEDQDHTLS